MPAFVNQVLDADFFLASGSLANLFDVVENFFQAGV